MTHRIIPLKLDIHAGHDQSQDLSIISGKRSIKLKAFYYPATNSILSENNQVVNGDRLKIC